MDDFSMLDLTNSKFEGASLSGKNFRGCTLVRTKWGNADVDGCNFKGANLNDARFGNGNSDGADFSDSTADKLSITGQQSVGSIFKRVLFNNGVFRDTKFHGCDFRGARIKDSNFFRASLERADLRDADFTGCTFTLSKWENATINAGTKVENTEWGRDHDANSDGQRNIKIQGMLNGNMNWERLRMISRFPLFTGAYIILGVGVVISLIIAWLNSATFVPPLDITIPYPSRMTILLVGSAALTVGTSVYQYYCPAIVKEYSSFKWTEELRRPIVQYLCAKLNNPFFIWVSAFFTYVGVFLLGGLFLDRFYTAVVVIWENL